MNKIINMLSDYETLNVSEFAKQYPHVELRNCTVLTPDQKTALQKFAEVHTYVEVSRSIDAATRESYVSCGYVYENIQYDGVSLRPVRADDKNKLKFVSPLESRLTRKFGYTYMAELQSYLIKKDAPNNVGVVTETKVRAWAIHVQKYVLDTVNELDKYLTLRDERAEALLANGFTLEPERYRGSSDFNLKFTRIRNNIRTTAEVGRTGSLWFSNEVEDRRRGATLEEMIAFADQLADNGLK